MYYSYLRRLHLGDMANMTRILRMTGVNAKTLQPFIYVKIKYNTYTILCNWVSEN